ncbi:MAG: nitrate reductase cytochrome c-type subunit [Nitrospira sp.]|nr:nitrate reductase cytochrome c-type subunit [Nitrospira sp.]
MTKVSCLKNWFVAVTHLASLWLWGGVILAQEGPQSDSSKKLPRAYVGAPPLIPHDVEARKGICLACHGTGEGGAPLAPHPTRSHFCLQCHVGQDLTVEPFVKELPPRE